MVCVDPVSRAACCRDRFIYQTQHRLATGCLRIRLLRHHTFSGARFF
jgi:hypothetical protein